MQKKYETIEMTQEEYEAHQIRVRRTLKKAIAAFVVLGIAVLLALTFWQPKQGVKNVTLEVRTADGTEVFRYQTTGKDFERLLLEQATPEGTTLTDGVVYRLQLGEKTFSSAAGAKGYVSTLTEGVSVTAQNGAVCFRTETLVACPLTDGMTIVLIFESV